MKKLTKLDNSPGKLSEGKDEKLNPTETKFILGGFSDTADFYGNCQTGGGCAYGCYVCCRMSQK